MHRRRCHMHAQNRHSRTRAPTQPSTSRTLLHMRLRTTMSCLGAQTGGEHVAARRPSRSKQRRRSSKHRSRPSLQHSSSMRCRRGAARERWCRRPPIPISPEPASHLDVCLTQTRHSRERRIGGQRQVERLPWKTTIYKHTTNMELGAGRLAPLTNQRQAGMLASPRSLLLGRLGAAALRLRQVAAFGSPRGRRS